MRVERLDHLVLTVTDVRATLNFYTRVCGMTHVESGRGRHALAFGDQKINLHVWGGDVEPKAALSTPGSADLCFVVDDEPDAIVSQLTELEIPVAVGPVKRAGAVGPVTSVYVRDPDGNLVELATYQPVSRPAVNGSARSDEEEDGDLAAEADDEDEVVDTGTGDRLNLIELSRSADRRPKTGRLVKHGGRRRSRVR